MDNKILILDKERIQRKIRRMAYEIWERHCKESTLHFVAVEGTGIHVARQLANHLTEISPLKIHFHSLPIDKRDPLKHPAQFLENLNDKSVVLIDDVANSGKTLLYAMKPLLTYMPHSIIIAVLVDRKHKSFPVSPDIVGHTIATTLQDHIEVVCEGDEIKGAYLQ
ncbi:MAG: phosphoribosyltransferase [Bacteroidetes bacterium]|nr:phosphoribosyltransferase [Bacteroidota bacterium]